MKPSIFNSRRSRLFGLTLSAMFLASAGWAPSPASAEERVFVMLDHAKIMRLDGPAKTIILGNPAIADATVFDNTTLVITGKSYGTTNLLVLDEDGTEITNSAITVRAADQRLVTVHRAGSRESFDCSPNCQPSLVLGDNSETFESINSQISDRNAIAEGGSTQ